VAHVEELEVGPPHDVALQNARRKATAVATSKDDERLVLGVDTVVGVGDSVYGKPSDATEAQATLRALSGRTHGVIGGLCLIGAGRTRTALTRTEVEFRTLDDAMLDWYLDTREWRERAGAYAIQGKGAALVTRIDGDYLNVVGLPVAALLELEPALIRSYRWGKCLSGRHSRGVE